MYLLGQSIPPSFDVELESDRRPDRTTTTSCVCATALGLLLLVKVVALLLVTAMMDGMSHHQHTTLKSSIRLNGNSSKSKKRNKIPHVKAREIAFDFGSGTF